MATPGELVETVDAVKRLIDAIARHKRPRDASEAIDEIGAYALEKIEHLHQAALLPRARKEGLHA